MTPPSGDSSEGPGRGAAPSSAGPVPLPAPKFATAARAALSDGRLRRNLAGATAVLRARRDAATAELDDWEELREAGRAIRDRTLLNLDSHLEELERAVTGAGGTVHWAADAAEARRIVTTLVRATGEGEVHAVRSAVAREIRLDEALERAGITVRGAGLAELVMDLDGDGRPSHPLFPALHHDRARIRDLLAGGPPGTPADLPDDPAALAGAARARLRDGVPPGGAAICGAAFLVAETGTVVLAEPGGGGRACAVLPETLICVAGIEEVVPTWADLEVFLQLLPRAAVGERTLPAISTWTGVTPGDGPAAFHLVLLDNGRTTVLADEIGRAALRCVRCAACLDVCPVYGRTGGDPYGPGLPGPIGAVLTPQVRGVESAAGASLPYASTLCGACADVCPVKIDIPDLLVHLRGRVVESRRRRPVPPPELAMMRALAWTMGDRRRHEAALRRGTRWARLLSRGGRIRRLPGLLGRWTDARDVPAPPAETFRAWWRSRARSGGTGTGAGPEAGR
ncbi:LutB/LldF family L-lactate oxidation iron-sulfur protein [Actinomadura viridis]|uniref:L-lactate dehydrogenase complex protein LldF n=1 Tax=Actinomadura viridis TaxID=58110 RepID=A0A931GJ79_9ACTN|nr:LUD domain-containing protein [Actinomadura viridis]MBG6089403.1 L-lactate dehydrogenase complex protein LldF [Actinomadura viridis]